MRILPDKKARTFWLDATGQRNTVSTITLLKHLCNHFVKITNVSQRPLSHSDCDYLSLLLCSRFGCENKDEVSLPVFGRF
eukprot:UN26334